MNIIKERSTAQASSLAIVARWLAFFPAAILSATAAQFLISTLNNFNLNYTFIDPQSFMGIILILFIGNFIFGIVLVFVGAFIAPNYKRIVAVSLAGFLLVGTGAVIAFSLFSQEYLNIFASVASNIGSVGMALVIYKGQILSQENSMSSDGTESRNVSSQQSLKNGHFSSKTSMEKAEDAPITFRILIDILQRQLEKAYPQVLLLPQWAMFQMAGTVAGCVALAIRLHFEVPKDQRTPLELTMRRILQKRFPDSEKTYDDCHFFISESLIEIPRSERSGDAIFILLAMWILDVVSGGKEINQHELVITHIAEVYQNETAGFWRIDSDNE
jgi:hypothetical protein